MWSNKWGQRGRLKVKGALKMDLEMREHIVLKIVVKSDRHRGEDGVVSCLSSSVCRKPELSIS
jgi:hypothetical protein